MSSRSNQTNETFLALSATADAARLLARSVPSVENREAAKAASAALSTWIMENNPPKARGFSSRAGQRQAAIARAEAQERAERRANQVKYQK